MKILLQRLQIVFDSHEGGCAFHPAFSLIANEA
jgi:hypothetical protein